MLVEAVRTRLDAEIPLLKGRVSGAADYVALLSGKSLSSAPVFAYVLYGGLAPMGRPTTAAGDFRQPVRRGVKVVIFYRTTDPKGERLLDNMEAMADDVLRALCGWRSDDEIGVFELAGAEVNDFRDGILSQRIDLTISDQLRFTS